MGKLPAFLEKYFWDVEFEKIDLRKSKIYVLKRILEYGDQDAVHWMWRNFKKDEIKDAVSRFRGYSKKSANYWAVILDIPKEKVVCLKKRLSRELKPVWPY